ncbi:MAG: tRNA (adenosine(37)-N6)-threonylcarbamoyltransferase complex ATPase subunit type 1 TsaE [Nocardioides sp.]
MSPTLARGGVAVAPVGAEAAAAVLEVVHAGFGARELLEPPSTATDETLASVADWLADHGGVLASSEAGPVGALLLDPHDDGMLGLRRVAVHPDAQGLGVARLLVAAAEDLARERGYDGLRLAARSELPRTVRFWAHLGYREVARDGVFLTLAKLLPVTITAPTPEDTRSVAARLAPLLRRGDLLILSGDLGAGKTTFTQGLGAALGVRGQVTSPTFVISRVHPSLGDGPALVHVDAYRLASGGAGILSELDDLDLDASVDGAVTVVEWGEGVAESLDESHLDVRILRPRGDSGRPADDESRTLVLTPVGPRWIGAGLHAALA